MKKLELATSSWDEREYKAIENVISSGKFTMGQKTSEFERSFSQYIGSDYSIMVNSGSSANLLAVAALFYKKNNPLKRGDEVIVPSVSWSTSYYPLLQYGLKVKFVDIDANTLNYDISALERAISSKTRLILIVNLLGNPNEFDEIFRLSRKYSLYTIEDNCESMGAKYKNKFTGTFSDIGTFSTYFSHHISTMEGGIIVTENEELYQIMTSLRAHGWTRDLPKNNKVVNKNEEKFYESFNFILPGYNLRPLEISAAVGVEQIKKLPEIIKSRRKNAKIFKQLFENDDRFLIQTEIGESSWFGFSIVIKPNYIDKLKRINIIKKLINSNIECRPIVAGNFIKNRVINFFDYEIHDVLKNANYIHENGFFVGNHHYDIEENLVHLKSIL